MWRLRGVQRHLGRHYEGKGCARSSNVTIRKRGGTEVAPPANEFQYRTVEFRYRASREIRREYDANTGVYRGRNCPRLFPGANLLSGRGHASQNNLADDAAGESTANFKSRFCLTSLSFAGIKTAHPRDSFPVPLHVGQTFINSRSSCSQVYFFSPVM